MKVRLKKEIVALGVKGISPIKKVGKYVAPNEAPTIDSTHDEVKNNIVNRLMTSLNFFI